MKKIAIVLFLSLSLLFTSNSNLNAQTIHSFGNMVKSVYDANNDGVVDEAETLSSSDTSRATITTQDISKTVGSGGDYSTIQDALEDLPNLIAHTVTFTIKKGTYTDTLDTTIHFSKLDTYVVFYRPLWGTDVSLAYDPDGNLHAVFTAKMFTVTNVEYDCSTSVYYGSTIMHWDEASGEVKNICPPRFVSSTLVPGGESSTADETVIRPSIGFDNEGTAYVIWEQAWPGYYAYRDSLWGFIATHPETLSDADMEELDSLWYYTTGGTLDANADGVANNEIFIARSFDGGATWTPPQNISNTHAKLTSAGDDMSELDISIARKVDDKVHIFAVLDKSAGKSPRDVGEKVNCPVLHIAVDTTILNCDTCFACPDKIAEKYNNRPNKIAIEAHPNPFNASTEISWNSPTGGHTTVEIVDVNGRVVRTLYDDFSSSGNHTVVWDGMDNVGKAVSTGTYFCRVKSGDMKAATKITLLK